MSKWFNKSADININIADPPLNFKYSPIDPKVSGTISIKFMEDVSKISNIRCGLAGTADIVYYSTDIQVGGFPAGSINRQLITQSVNFFNIFIDLPLGCNDGCDDDYRQDGSMLPSYNFTAGEKLESNFSFEFPDSLYLPGSCKNFGNIDGDISVTYEVYVDINKSSRLLSGKPRRHTLYKVPIGYQGRRDPTLDRNVTTNRYVTVHTFKDKVKKFYFDKGTNALIPTSLEKPHSKTKFIRQLWNNDYKPENYANITKTIPMQLDLSVRSMFDLAEPFGSQFALTLVSDLKSVGIDTNQGKDFVLNDQSTKLGLFNIESLLIESQHDLVVRCYQYVMREQCRDTILKINFKDLFVDVKDFTYNKENMLFKYEISNEELTKAADLDMTKSLMDLMDHRSIMCSGSIPTWFTHSVRLDFTWKLSDGSSQKKKYQFFTNVTPDFLVGMHDGPSTDVDDADFVPPPTYEMSNQEDALVGYDDLKD